MAFGLALLALGAAVVSATRSTSPPPDPRPNILLVLTDDQSLDTLASDPPAMPWLRSQLQDPNGHWLWFPNAVVSTPLCCPSRATILTGRYDVHTGVRDNFGGPALNDANTLPVWLHGAGYTTALVGKYLNNYPFGRAPFVPPGWDRWFAKENTNDSTAYYDYDVVDQGVARHYGAAPQDYATDVLTDAADSFLRSAPADRPWFLYFAPNAPHAPWVPAPRYRDAFAGLRPTFPSLAQLNDVDGKPGYVRSQPPLDDRALDVLRQEDVLERETLLSIDDTVREMVAEVAARGELERTVVIFLTDNGYSFGLHRLEGKRYPYEPSIGVPFAVRSPWARAGTVPEVVANVDLASTIAGLAGVTPGLPQDGVSFASTLRGGAMPSRAGVWLDWGGDAQVPPWSGIRAERFTYVRNADGTEELYLLDRDPLELRNLAGIPRYAGLVRRARSSLGSLAPPGSGG